ncbi:MAG: RagB/SusD family nutrient uptake outer membrane protein [Bacteroidaceae bacterium]|nr:RagB/SusD family nutrient uptake outer membrane protein [Bacteroidaceae bacterium]
MKLKYYILGLVSACAITSCNDSFLDRAPKDKLSDTSYWQNQDDAEKFANGIYRYLVQPENHTIMTDCYTANAIPVHVTAEQGQLSAGSAVSTNPHFTQLWAEAYYGIRRCLIFQEHIDEVPMNEASKATIKAEVQFLEAFFYATLLKYMGGVPILDHAMALSEEMPARNTEEEVYSHIITLLDAAAPNLPSIRSNSDHGKPSAGACMALKARVAYYAHKYEVAEQAAKAVMDMGKFDLADNYETLFRPESEFDNEIIFNKEFNETPANSIEGNKISLFFMPVAFGAWEALSPTQDMIDAYLCTDGLSITESPLYDPANPYENRDPRLAYSVLWPGATYPVIYNGTEYTLEFDNQRMGDGSHTRTGYSMRKYLDPEDYGIWYYGQTNFIYIRYAEVLLTYAEARNENVGPDELVYAAVNQVRQRPSVNMPTLEEGLTKDEMRAAIRHERRIELAFEGIHLFDTRSWKTTEEEVKRPVWGIDQQGEPIHVETRNFNPNRDYLWAIPSEEVDLSKGVLKQNPGWD